MNDDLKRRLQKLRTGRLTNRLDQINLVHDVFEEHARLKRIIDQMALVNADLMDQTGAALDIVGVE